jgi:hypothetical protein
VEGLTRTVILHFRFDGDLSAAMDWYDDRVPGLGVEFESETERCLDEVERRPLSYQLARDRLRQAPLKRFPYVIVFEVTEAEILVAGLFHSAMDRQRWDERT